MIKINEKNIALFPSKPRDSCNLMVLNLEEKKIIHSKFYNLHKFLKKGDLIIVNNTKVIPAKIFGRKNTGGKVEALFVKKIDEKRFYSLLKGKNVKNFYVGEFRLKVIGKNKFYIIEIENGNIDKLLKKYGKMPLPPYIKREPVKKDEFYYNSIFAKKEGSIAAPTASLHFTERLIKKLKKEGIKVKELTLHIGPFTFLNNIEDEEIIKEFYEIPEETLMEIEKTKKNGGRIISVGTTVTRALETWGLTGKRKGYTDLIIKPGFEFKVSDILLTNFHLENLSPILLTLAFVKDENLLRESYKEAIKRNYRFYSFGDAMLIIP
ncbi:MAG: tRNA preQ1(34) S-adenosylmethionine ribosyltransferase-isomerase QueA [candidate division WOR-3 bacterium]